MSILFKSLSLWLFFCIASCYYVSKHHRRSLSDFWDVIYNICFTNNINTFENDYIRNTKRIWSGVYLYENEWYRLCLQLRQEWEKWCIDVIKTIIQSIFKTISVVHINLHSFLVYAIMIRLLYFHISYESYFWLLRFTFSYEQ